MLRAASVDNQLRVAIVGAGPAGFYVASHLLKQHPSVAIDVFERLPTPFGLVRAGVAPDHQKDKSVVRTFDKVAASQGFRLIGNVGYGRDVTLTDLRSHYHQVVFTTGARHDRELGIAGENLDGSHSAADFVAWYNGHPDYADLEFNLDKDAAVVVGLGNVALDVARMLLRSHEDLRVTDMADYAIEALRHSRVRTVYLLGRRGPAQAAFTPAELAEMAELADVQIARDEADLDDLSKAALAESGTRNARKNVAMIRELASGMHTDLPAHRGRLAIRFFVSPVALLGNDAGEVRAVRIVRNEAYLDEEGHLRARPTGEETELPAGLVFRSVGYRSEPLPDLPFDAQLGRVPNQLGRVSGPRGDDYTGLYVAGWLKRGPVGVIGTNKTDAKETVEQMLADVDQLPQPPSHPDELVRRLRDNGARVVGFADWQAIDTVEVSAGVAAGRPRRKLTRISDLLDAAFRK